MNLNIYQYKYYKVKHRGKKPENKDSLNYVWNNIKYSNLFVFGIPEIGKERKKYLKKNGIKFTKFLWKLGTYRYKNFNEFQEET